MTNRWPAAISAGFAVALMQIGGLAAVGYLAWKALASPAPGRMTFALAPYAHEFRGELIFPECEMSSKGAILQSGAALSLRAVELKTGASRAIALPTAIQLQYIVSDGKRLWLVAMGQILEFDGTAFRTIQPDRKLGTPVSRPFVYQGNLADVDQDRQGHFHVFALIEDQWQDQGRIALPGPSRQWILDATTGDTVLAPRDSSLSIGGFPLACQVHVVEHLDEYQMFQFDQTVKPSLSVRAGIEFIRQPMNDDPVSALVTENEVAEATGWSLLEIEFSRGFSNVGKIGDALLLCNDKDIWKLSPVRETPGKLEFQRFLPVELEKNEYLKLVPSSATDDMHILACPILDDIKVLHLQNGQLKKLPYTIAGVGRPIQRWMLTTLFQVLVVLVTGTLVLIFLAGRLSRVSTYTFGHETVTLASITKRSLARSVDLILLCGPLVIHAVWLVWNTSFETLVNSLDESFGSGLTLLRPAALWLALGWLALAVMICRWGTTPGKWLFGLRVVRTSLRPCRILTSVLRELLFWIDTSQLLSAIPGIVCMMGTQNRQRIGDLIAGTLVLDTRSNPTK